MARPGDYDDYRQRDDNEEDYDNGPRRRYRDDNGEETFVRTLVPTRNPKALTAYYGGIFGLIPLFGLLLGPIALLFGILGLRHANRYCKAKGGGHAITGLVLGPLGFLLSIGEMFALNVFLHSTKGHMPMPLFDW
jgi:hypothetical protein